MPSADTHSQRQGLETTPILVTVASKPFQSGCVYPKLLPIKTMVDPAKKLPLHSFNNEKQKKLFVSEKGDAEQIKKYY